MVACPPGSSARRKRRTRSLRLHVAYDVDPSLPWHPRSPLHRHVVELARASGDEHAIKLTEAALRTFAPSSDEVVLVAAADATARL
jgi:hypothetical protein